MKRNNKILIAPTDFKGSISAVEVAEIIATELKEKFADDRFEITERPVSDGGDGFLQTLSKLHDLEILSAEIPLPYDLGKTFGAKFGYDKKTKTAYVESAEIIGLKITPPEYRNPLFLSSYGLGKLLKFFDEQNRAGSLLIEKVIIGLGGSATQDAGLGIAAAFGLRLLKCSKALPITPKFYPSADKIKFNTADFALSFKILTVADVENPLLGTDGANKVFAEQKGATKNDIPVFEKGFKNVLRLLRANGTAKFSGAAGGTAFALKYFFDAEIISAKDFIAETYLKNLPEICCAITGEGKLDEQTFYGKAPAVIYERYPKAKIFFIVGKNTLNKEQNFTIIETSKFYENENLSIKEPRAGIEKAAEVVSKLITENF